MNAKKYTENLTGTTRSYNPNLKNKILKKKNINHINPINSFNFDFY